MLDSMYHVHSDTLVVGSRIVSNSFVNERLVLINLIELSCFCVYPHGAAIDLVEFQSFCVVAGDLEAVHVNRLTVERVQFSLVSRANQLLLGLGDLLEAWKFPAWCVDSDRDRVINPKT